MKHYDVWYYLGVWVREQGLGEYSRWNKTGHEFNHWSLVTGHGDSVYYSLFSYAWNFP